MLTATGLMRRTFATLLVAGVWLGSAAGASAAAIKGTVQYVGAPVQPKKLPITVDQFVCGKDKDAEELSLSPQRGVRNAVVSLAAPPPDAR